VSSAIGLALPTRSFTKYNQWAAQRRRSTQLAADLAHFFVAMAFDGFGLLFVKLSEF
jgi:hypothetical protein